MSDPLETCSLACRARRPGRAVKPRRCHRVSPCSNNKSVLSVPVWAPDGPDYQFGDLNRSKLTLYRQSTVRPVSEPVGTVMDQSRLLVQASSIICRFYSPLTYPPTTPQSCIGLPSQRYPVEIITSDTLTAQQSHFLEYFSACYENYACHTQIYITFSTIQSLSQDH